MVKNSNTTLVKVKSVTNETGEQIQYNSNTTLVKVKWEVAYYYDNNKLEFKYNTC